MAVLRTGEGFSASPKSIGTELPCPLVITGEIGTTQPADGMQIWSNGGALTIGAGGGGGGGSLDALSDVSMGDIGPLAQGDMLYLISLDPEIWTNVPSAQLVSGFIPAGLAALPGVAEGRILSIVGGNPTWIDPA